MKEIVFIDSRVENYQSLAANVEPEAEVVILDPTGNGVEQITQVLVSYTGIEEIHIVSIGTEESLQLGSTQLDADNLEAYTSQLQQWATALTDNAVILLYDCQVVSGQAGEAFVQQLSQLTGADVATANDLTDNTQLGGDWYLERQLEIELHNWINLTGKNEYATHEEYFLK